MDQQLNESWKQLTNAVSIEQNVSAMTLAIYLLLGGAISIYIRFLYRHCGRSTSDTESITRIFPLLTLVTIGVITVVKSSMALSLGLVGALSIVRFRAAIKDPEELVYLFLCIGVGLALGAGQPLLAIVVVIVASLFVLTLHFSGRGRREQNLLLTITTDVDRFVVNDERNVVRLLQESVRDFSLQRLDIQNEQGQVRVVLKDCLPQGTVATIAALRQRLPGCEISYVNLNSSW